MNIEEFRDYCLAKKHVSECFPFDEQTLVFKVADKMFAYSGLEHHPAKVNLKCDPDWAIELREEYEEIVPGYHSSKIHWNTVIIEGTLQNSFIKQLIDHSYAMVIKGMSKKKQKELGFL
ncbi:MmcQ/YjbR family DNA-binding protein [Lutibacter sp. B1]|uniref:MmcQ/YjbR family DNA-binding protein n=1 Tax=Lutibacter sp. B1 TaxID=2725996 RepID=UPI00145721CE|nr:MmcQ/YjbR family DNA-binding protein [Lutibacter sp. B1]NLP59173.1 MmcQ/YjbR family DNA-binding protein [Lutibacter sp. B1]